MDGKKSMFDIAYEQNMIEREEAYKKLGLSPEGPTYEEALGMQLMCWHKNELAILEGIEQQEEMKKKVEKQNVSNKKEEDYYPWQPDLSAMPQSMSSTWINGILMFQELERRDREKDQKK